MSAEGWNTIVECTEPPYRHPDHALSYEVVPEGFLVKMWNQDNVNDITYGPFPIRPENCQRVQHSVDKRNTRPCQLGICCPGQGLPEESMSPEDWDALNAAVHHNESFRYAIAPHGIVVKQQSTGCGNSDIAYGPYAIKDGYRQQAEAFVAKSNEQPYNSTQVCEIVDTETTEV